MIELLLTTVGLGLAGLDPAGALIAAGALGAGARERDVAAYGFIVLFGTVVFGMTLSIVAGPHIATIDWGSVAPGDPTAAVVEAVLGAGLVVWGIVRARRRDIHAPKPRSPRGTSLVPLVVTGILFAFLAILDPTFAALVVVVGQDKPFWLVAIAYTIWIFVSQAPLAVVIAAMAGGKHQGIVDWFQSWWTKIRPTVGRLVTAAVLFVGVFFLLDSVWWFATGEFLEIF